MPEMFQAKHRRHLKSKRPKIFKQNAVGTWSAAAVAARQPSSAAEPEKKRARKNFRAEGPKFFSSPSSSSKFNSDARVANWKDFNKELISRCHLAN